MGRIIPLPGDEHRDLQGLLPWFVSGQLEASEQARLEAHLAGCAECQAELRFQRELAGEIRRLPIDVDQGWARMRARLEREGARPARQPDRVRRPRTAPGWLGALASAAGGARSAPVLWSGWAAASLLLVAALALAIPATHSPAYRALSAAPEHLAGNVVVMFGPETRETRMREILTGAQARLVDGPTAAGGYVLHVPEAQRAAILAQLRTRPDVLLAEPVDAGPPR